MTAVLRLECTLVEELAHGQRAHMKLIPFSDASLDDEFVSDRGKLTIDVPDARASITFSRGTVYLAHIFEEV